MVEITCSANGGLLSDVIVFTRFGVLVMATIPRIIAIITISGMSVESKPEISIPVPLVCCPEMDVACCGPMFGTFTKVAILFLLKRAQNQNCQKPINSILHCFCSCVKF